MMVAIDFSSSGCICLYYLPLRAIHRERLIHRHVDISSSYFKNLGRIGDARDGLAVHNVCNFSRGSGLLDSTRPYRGGLKVDLTLRLNVLAVCAAIAFVGAVLIMF